VDLDEESIVVSKSAADGVRNADGPRDGHLLPSDTGILRGWWGNPWGSESSFDASFPILGRRWFAGDFGRRPV